MSETPEKPGLIGNEPLASEELGVEPEDYSDFDLPEDDDPGDGDDLSWLDEEDGADDE